MAPIRIVLNRSLNPHLFYPVVLLQFRLVQVCLRLYFAKQFETVGGFRPHWLLVRINSGQLHLALRTLYFFLRNLVDVWKVMLPTHETIPVRLQITETRLFNCVYGLSRLNLID
jgi:hypothetical protein